MLLMSLASLGLAAFQSENLCVANYRNHAAIESDTNPRQCFRHRYDAKLKGDVAASVVGSGNWPPNPAWADTR